MFEDLKKATHKLRLSWIRNKKRFGFLGEGIDFLLSDRFFQFILPSLVIAVVFYWRLSDVPVPIKFAIWSCYTIITIYLGFIYRQGKEIKSSLGIDKKLDTIKGKDNELRGLLSSLIDESASAVNERNSGHKIEKVKNSINQTLFILEKSVYYKEAFKPEELFLGTKSFSVAISSVDISYINQPPYFLYLLEHHNIAIGKEIFISKDKLKSSTSFNELLQTNKIANLRFYIYPSEEMILNREVFNTIEQFCSKLNLNPFLIQSEKLIEDVYFYDELKKLRNTITAYATLKNYKLPNTSKINEVIPDFLINDEVLTIVFQNQNGEPIYEKFKNGSSEFDMFFSLLDKLIKLSNYHHFIS